MRHNSPVASQRASSKRELKKAKLAQSEHIFDMKSLIPELIVVKTNKGKKTRAEYAPPQDRPSFTTNRRLH